MKANQTDWDRVLEQVKHVFEEQVPFNKLLGLRIDELDEESVQVRLVRQDEHIGNFFHGILHGGVISSILDVTGGLTAFVALLRKMNDVPDAAKLERLARFGTIDLRVDFLRPGKGCEFISSGTILRAGNKVAVTRMELYNETNHLIAVGTGTYLSV